MHKILTTVLILIATCSSLAAFVRGCRKEPSTGDATPSSEPDELELRRRAKETMFRHERRAVHERHFKELEQQRLQKAAS